MNKMTLTTLWNGSLKKIDTHSNDIKLTDLTKN
jgi:hypothetical protein